ncbi:MAG: histidine phosphatase family protein [Sedimentibacter sp.]|uniref:histidine phosphatase family protein n=1 Tax=Sedimentibacter sp. TaxID=1960295 RepID=UPI0029821742|nr:histidine phosphatase family protein [Sedimentibacter sp.]MDW5299224.1 histidine phosphatase family protein [Sedimentibacter sp.]
MTRIYFTRHGETEWNKQKRFQGNKNSALTEKGILAAELLSSRIEEIDLDCIISSPLMRAYHTAEILRGNRNIEIIKHDGFKEINLGDFEGLRYDEIKLSCSDVLNKIEDDPFNNCYPNGENLLEFYKRVEKSFKEIISKYKHKNTLIVAHGGTIKCIESYIRNFQIDKDWMGSVVNNCSLSCVEVDENNEIKEIFYNDTQHLKGSLSYN